jgi:hypothetical protein
MKNIITLCCFFTSLSIIAQTGPAGVGKTSNNPIWLDASDLKFTNNTPVSLWPDKSGNGNDFTQGTSNRQPLWLNYTKPMLRFNGISTYLYNGGAPGMNSNTLTQFIVADGVSGSGIITASAYSEHNSLVESWAFGGDFKTRVFNSSYQSKFVSNTASASPQIWSFSWDGAVNQNITGYQDGNNVGTTPNAANTATGNWRNVIGARTNYSSPFNGDIFEIINYSKVLNSAERKIVENYLSSKYGIAVATDLYAYDVNEGNELFGIGQEADGANLSARGTGKIEISNATSLSNGDYVLSGHNNSLITAINNDVPATLVGGTRIRRKWRVGVTGSPGKVDVLVDVTGMALPAGSYYLLVESNNGIFNDGGVVSYGPLVDVGGFVNFKGVSFADGDYYTIATDVPTDIFSIRSGDWATNSTWSCNCVPGAGDNAIVSTGDVVTVTTAVSVKNITIDGTLNTIQVPYFDVYGDYTVNATGAALHKVITFRGTKFQKLVNNSATSIDFNKMYVFNANNVGLNGGSFEVANSVKVDLGRLQNFASIFTFRSDATRTAVILESFGSGFDGHFVMERYFSGRTANWGDLSTPVAFSTLRQWDSDKTGTVTELYMSDVNGIDGRVGNPGDFYSVWEYNEILQKSDSITDTSYVLIPGRGIELWLGDNLTTFSAKKADIEGLPNFGNIIVPVSNTWNLLGNPYQSWINWGGISKPTLKNTYYIYNTNTGNFSARTSGAIPPQQGFWVESIGAGSVTFMEASKNSTGSSVFYREIEEDLEPIDFIETMLMIKSNNYSYSHELKLRLNNLASEELDEFDASFLPSRLAEAPSITSYSNSSNKKLAINSFNFKEEIIIPVAVQVGISGEHIIEAVNFEELKNDYLFMELKDLVTGKIYDVANNNEVLVDINKGDNPDRFELRLSNLVGQASETNNGINIYKTSQNTIIEFDNVDANYEISIYNAIGQEVIQTMSSINSDKLYIDNSKLPSGVNIITVKSIDGVVTKKLIY